MGNLSEVSRRANPSKALEAKRQGLLRAFRAPMPPSPSTPSMPHRLGWLFTEASLDVSSLP